MNGLSSINVTINLKKKIKNSNVDVDFKKPAKLENNGNLSRLEIEGFFHVPWKKYKKLRVLFT